MTPADGADENTCLSPATLAAVLRQLADLAEIRGSADVPDLRRAVETVASLPTDEFSRLLTLARRNGDPIPGVAPAAQWRIREIAIGGGEDAVRAGRSGIPLLHRRLLELGALTSAEAASLVRQLGILTLADLEAALEDGRAERMVRPPISTRLAQAAHALALEIRPVTLGRAWDIFEGLRHAVAYACPEVSDLTLSGDARRFEPLVNGIVAVGHAIDPGSAINAIAAARGIEDVLSRTTRRALLLVQQTEIDLRIAASEEFGTVLFSTTGTAAHVRAVTERRGTRPLAAREEDVYAQFGLPWIAPELRHASGELESAATGALPRLVERGDIRGDLHMHTTYSDGQDTLETMIAASAALGYEYVAITDHSETAGASRTLLRNQIAQQRDEIVRLRERFPQLTILHGVEVDILADGRLDFDDGILVQFDIVLASLHDAARHDATMLTRRCLQAIRHPLVNVITHPANQLVGRRAGYPLNYPEIYAAAAETGTALEVDGAPSHLDLDGEHARAAVAAGVTVTIDSDSHRARVLEQQMRFGVATARRGWVEPRHVLNTRPVADVLAFIRQKRA